MSAFGLTYYRNNHLLFVGNLEGVPGWEELINNGRKYTTF